MGNVVYYQFRKTNANNDRIMKIQIGTVTLLKAETIHNASYQTASAWHDTDCEPQTVPIMINLEYRSWVVWGFRGIISKSFYQNRLGSSTSNSIDKDRGQETVESVQPYTYSVAKMIGEAGSFSFEQNGRRFDFDSRLIVGAQMEHSEIFGNVHTHYSLDYSAIEKAEREAIAA